MLIVYKRKLKEDGVTDEMIYTHMQNIITRYISSPPQVSLSMDLVNSSHSSNNCTTEVRRKLDLKLLLKSDHALAMMKIKIESALRESFGSGIEGKVSPDPIVSTQQNFDSLLIPDDHYCRRPSDVYYVTHDAILRTHLTAHLADSVRAGTLTYFMSGPVFRRLEEDDQHSELCHQVGTETFK